MQEDGLAVDRTVGDDGSVRGDSGYAQTRFPSRAGSAPAPTASLCGMMRGNAIGLLDGAPIALVSDLA